MLALFRRNHILRSVALLFYVIIVRSFAFFHTEIPADFHAGVVSNFLYEWIDPTSILSDIIAIILIFFQAVLINRTVIMHRLTNEITLFSGLFYVLFTAMVPSFQWLSPALLGNTFIIIAYHQFFHIYGKKLVAIHLFNIGFLIGLAGLLHAGFYFFILWAIVATVILKSINLRLLLQLITGVAIPLFWAASFYFLSDSMDGFLLRLETDWGLLSFNFTKDRIIQAASSVMLALILISIVSHDFAIKKKLIKARKGIDVLYWALLFGSSGFLFLNKVDELHFLVILVPLSIIISFLFSSTKKESLAELCHFALFIICIMLNIYSII